MEELVFERSEGMEGKEGNWLFHPFFLSFPFIPSAKSELVLERGEGTSLSFFEF